ncbi:hypothetical protein [Streptomyces sp. NPDC127084]|uniref:hypothetical protein n=1 Tax=Streptomyces sp. NPDC127084 TaxID=3347133 RepID=UPI0036638116
MPDLVGRRSTAERPGEKLVGYVMHVPTDEGRRYLATVIDWFIKEAIGHATQWTTTTRRR